MEDTDGHPHGRLNLRALKADRSKQRWKIHNRGLSSARQCPCVDKYLGLVAPLTAQRWARIADFACHNSTVSKATPSCYAPPRVHLHFPRYYPHPPNCESWNSSLFFKLLIVPCNFSVFFFNFFHCLFDSFTAFTDDINDTKNTDVRPQLHRTYCTYHVVTAVNVSVSPSGMWRRVVWWWGSTDISRNPDDGTARYSGAFVPTRRHILADSKNQ